MRTPLGNFPHLWGASDLSPSLTTLLKIVIPLKPWYFHSFLSCSHFFPHSTYHLKTVYNLLFMFITYLPPLKCKFQASQVSLLFLLCSFFHMYEDSQVEEFPCLLCPCLNVTFEGEGRDSSRINPQSPARSGCLIFIE